MGKVHPISSFLPPDEHASQHRFFHIYFHASPLIVVQDNSINFYVLIFLNVFANIEDNLL
ncbi:hypothetical protein Scep_001924 [Stephania cephalantha]|uniref:Uncharacterized protein n=1 Tax=Stephania cephalantha TaxID=152367 RepID=A0AAP0Q4H4_9MAGN